MSTRASWKELVTEAWKDGGWDGVRGRIDLVSADEYPGPIIVWNYNWLIDVPNSRADATWSTTESVWQLNWILEQYPAPFEELVQDYERHFAFILDGMRDLWFCVGLLEGDCRFLPFMYLGFQIHDNPSEDLLARVVRPFLRAFARWLPDIMLLDDRIAAASRPDGVGYVGVASRLGIICDMLLADGKLDQHKIVNHYSKNREALVPLIMENYG
jgi:hypothetical protein